MIWEYFFQIQNSENEKEVRFQYHYTMTSSTEQKEFSTLW